MKNRKDFIKEYIEKNKDNLNIEDAMNAVFDFTNDFIEVENELPSEENGFLNKVVLIVIKKSKHEGKFYCKSGVYNKESSEWKDGLFSYSMKPNGDYEHDRYVVAWKPINFEKL